MHVYIKPYMYLNICIYTLSSHNINHYDFIITFFSLSVQTPHSEDHGNHNDEDEDKGYETTQHTPDYRANLDTTAALNIWNKPVLASYEQVEI